MVLQASSFPPATPDAADRSYMSPDASQVTDHVFVPLLQRAQLVSCGLVLTGGLVFAGFSAFDLTGLRHFFY